MRFLVDARCDARIAAHLRQRGHDATRVGSDYPADLSDLKILQIAHREDRILVTDDRDFGELVYRMGLPHAGVIYLRLATYEVSEQCARLDSAIERYGTLPDQFIVVSSRAIRTRGRE